MQQIWVQCSRCGFNPWVRRICWRRKWQTTPVSLPGKSHGQRSLKGYSLWGLRELDMTEQLSMHNEILKSATSHLYIKDKGIESHISKIGTTRDKSSWWTGWYGVSSSVTAALQQTHIHTHHIYLAFHQLSHC